MTPCPQNGIPGNSPVPSRINTARDIEQEAEDTDAYILRKKKMVAVTPINLDMTARVNFSDFDKLLRD